MGEVLGEDLQARDYEDRLATLIRHRVGLWDVVGEATRPGSLDTAIRDVLHNDLAALVATLPDLRAVAFNGGKAAKEGMPMLAGLKGRLALIPLPSSSPALTTPYAAKAAAWSLLREALA
jgi:hypoxanthine-DNA glycosylase